MTATEEYEKSIVALACWQQANAEMYPGMVMAAHVLRNRARAGWFEESIYRNAVAILTEHPSKEYPDPRDPQFQEFLVRLNPILTGKAPDKSGGAMWWVDTRNAQAIAGEVTATVGRMLFFK